MAAGLTDTTLMLASDGRILRWDAKKSKVAGQWDDMESTCLIDNLAAGAQHVAIVGKSCSLCVNPDNPTTAAILDSPNPTTLYTGTLPSDYKRTDNHPDDEEEQIEKQIV